MTVKRNLLITFLFIIVSGNLFSQQGFIDLGGKWKFRKAGTMQWFDATVPGCVHTDLMKNKLLEDPYYRDNEKKAQWVGETGWEYIKEFNVNDEVFAKRHIELVFKGLDTYANVYLNDSLIIVADNMFREWYAEVKFILKSGHNVLKVQFPSVKTENASRYSKLPLPLPGDEKVVCRKAAYEFGWDWGPSLITSGIWRPVMLRTWNYTSLLGIQYIQKSLSDSSAEMSAVFTLLSALGDTATFNIINEGKVLATKRAGIKRGANVVRVDFRIENPRRWWCNGLGKPELYNISHEIWFAGRKEDSGTKKIGLRTLELLQERDSVGNQFTFILNGVPVFMKGANYIPQDNFPSRVSDSSYEEVIKSAAAANMNMLRVWGGGIYENDIFYDLCDRYGILVWQDFMFANAMYPDTKDFLSNVQAEIIQNIVRLRNHPSLAVWCGNNEIEEGWHNWGWSKQYGYNPQDSAKLWLSYKETFWNMFGAMVTKFDTLRPYIKTSPMIGWGRPDSYRRGDSHYWGVWWGKEPFSKYEEKIGRFVSEYGFQGFPGDRTINKFTLPEDRKLNSPVMKAHQKHPEGYQIIDEYMKRDFKKPEDFSSYGYVSMLLQAEGYRIAIEAHRRAKPYCMGTLYWQMNDCWPVVSWSSQDYYGEKKAVWYAVKDLYRNFMVSAVRNKDAVDVYVVSDSLMPVNAALQVRLMDVSGKIISDTTVRTVVAPNSSAVKLKMNFTSADTTKTFISIKLRSGDKTLAENIKYLCKPAQMKLPVPVITSEIKSAAGGYSVTLKSDVLARGVNISLPVKGEFADNYFDLLPGETKSVYFKLQTKEKPLAPKLKVRTLRDTYQ